MDLYHEAASKGHPRAMSSIGYMFQNGEGVNPNYQEALKWYQQAAQAGFAEAYNNLASLYYYGQGVQRDYYQAYYWLQLAAAGHYPINRATLSALEKSLPPAKVSEIQQQVQDWQKQHIYWTNWIEFIKYGRRF